MRPDVRAENRISDQVGGFVWNGLQEEVFGVVTVHLAIEPQQITRKVGHSSTLSFEIQSDAWSLEAPTKMRFGQRITMFEAGNNRFHTPSIRLRCSFQKARPTGSQNMPLSSPAAMYSPSSST